MSNRTNKEKLIALLIEKLKTVNITTKQARDDADVLIIETAIEESKHQRTAVIVGEDIDLLVILIGRTQSYDREIFFKKIGKGNVKTQIYSCKSFDKYPQTKKHILFLHAFSGCDTTSALFKKGKKTFIKTLEQLPDFDKLAQAFQQEHCPPEILHDNGIRIFLAMYNADKSEISIDHLRYTRFIKLTKFNKPVQLANLPPTSAAAHQHINRVYYQIQTWLGYNLEPQEWGWVLQNRVFEPIKTTSSPAPDELLNTIFCNCKNGCGTRCGCRKSGLPCSPACGQCSGQACLNASPYQSDLDEDETCDPGILEDLTGNIFENENDNAELEIIERPEDDDEGDN